MPDRIDPEGAALSGSGPDLAATTTGVFVYGTLRPGRSNWAVAAPYCARHEPAVLTGYALYALEYPAVVAHPGTDHDEEPTRVRGDLLWLVPPRAAEALERLDRFEGVVPGDHRRSYYRRVVAPVTTLGGDSHRVWTYVPGDDLLTQVHPRRRVPGDAWPP